MKNEITVSCFLIIDGSTVPVEELSKEQRRRWKEEASRRLSENMSAYYSQHPEEYIKLRKESAYG